MSVAPTIKPLVAGIVRGLVPGGGAADSLVFHALDDVGGTFVNDVIVGTGSLTEGSTSTRYAVDDSGVYQAYTSGVPAKAYADSKWWAQATPALTNSLPYSLPDTSNWTLTEGTENDLVTNGDFSTGTDWTLGTGWSIGSGVASCDGTQTSNSNLYQAFTGTQGSIHKVTFTVSNYSAGTVQTLIGTASGTARSANGTYSEYITASGGNFLLRAAADFVGDIDDVSVRLATVSELTTGLDGAADSAVVLTDDDGSAYEYVEEGVTTTASQVDVLRLFIKKDTDETRFPRIYFYNDATHRIDLHVNTKTGAANLYTDIGTNDYDVRDAGDWLEVLLSMTNADTSTTIRIYPAIGSAIDTPSTAATGSITVGNCELHLNTTIAAVRGSGPVFTSGSPVTQTASALSFDDANHQTEGGYYFEFTPYAATSELSGDHELLSLNAGADLLYYDATNSQVESADGTNTAAKSLTLVSGTTYQIGLAYGGSNMRINVDGTWGTEASFDGSYPAGSALEVMNSFAQTGLMRNLRAYSQSYTDAQTTIDGLMGA